MAPASSSAAARGAKVSSSSSQPSSLPSTPYRQPSSSTDDLAQPLCLPTPAAGPLTRTLHHLYPIALAVVFVRRFPSLVSDPDAELGGTLTAALLGIQAAWLVVCVPTAGSTSAAASKKSRLGASGRRKASEKDGARSGLGWFVMIVGALLVSLILALLLATPIIHCILVLFGAPFLQHVRRTLLLALHISLFTVLPAVYSRGTETITWMDAVLSNKTSLDAIAAGSGLAVLGAWLGAIPIPLDWDRDWQAWPVTVLAGAWMGYVVGVVLGGTVLWGWRLGRSSGKS